MIKKNISEMLVALQKEGLNLSVRSNPKWAYRRQDNSLFALCSSLFVLQNVEKYFSEKEQILFLELQEKITSLYLLFKNKDGRHTFNFYPTQPSAHFANGYLMRRFDHFRLPDDIDDTALVFLTDNSLKSKFEFLSEHLNQHKHPSGVFNTWFGKNMPLEIDICANINMLILFYKNGHQEDIIAKEVLNLLIVSIERIVKTPFILSRHYGHPILILYHYARFMYLFPNTILKTFTSRLVEITTQLLSQNLSYGFRMLAETSLLKWGEKRKKLNIEPDFKNFYTFIGAPLAPILGENTLAFNSFFLIYWHSDMCNNAFNLEYELIFENSL
jgi:hypothetical protein